MPIRSLAILTLALGLGVSARAQNADEIVRLPTPGEVKPDAPFKDNRPKRLVPGGGLFLSFDANADGRISQAELDAGIADAFTNADANGDNALTALEQQAWATSLPTHDDSLANPVRFDPNLDRMVSVSEFSSVITDLAVTYAEPSGDILVASLKAPDRRPRDDAGEAERPRPDRARGEQRPRGLLH